MRKVAILLSMAAACWLLVFCDDDGPPSDGDGDSDGDVDGDSDGDSDGDADADGDADGDSDVDVDADEPEYSFVDASGDEICGNCTDEDGDGEMPWCGTDELFLTPRLVEAGGVVTVTIQNRSDTGYSCVDVACHRGDEVATGRRVDQSYSMDLFRWVYEIRLPTPGAWSCLFMRLNRGDDGLCTRVGAEPRACDTLTVE